MLTVTVQYIDVGDGGPVCVFQDAVWIHSCKLHG